MIATFGEMALAAALLLCVLQMLFAGQAALTPTNKLAHTSLRGMVYGQVVLSIVAYVCLTWLFLIDDFSVIYVAGNSHLELPVVYKFTAVWGGHEGSLLLWLLMLAGWTLAVALRSAHLPPRTAALVLGVLGFVSLGFYSFTLWTSNPFDLHFPVPLQGNDLNPLLQDPGMIVHPPLLYMGYVGFAVAFAFAVAALIEGRLDSQWARWTRPWTTSAWAFLTAGIALGSWWAYHELGWGGWWFWDPVENASFMPWLVGTALIHSLAATDKRGVLKSWTVLLAIIAFALSLLGTFLVRSGVLVSVHAFASDPERGRFILAFLAIVVGGAMALYAWRAPQLGAEARIAPVSRENALLLNNVFLAVLAAVVFIGTLYPLAVDSLGIGHISVGPPYFEALFVPLGLPLVFLIGFAGVIGWKRASLLQSIRPLWMSALIAIVAGFALWIGLYSARSAMALIGIVMGLWAIVAAAREIIMRARGRGSIGGIPTSIWGMNLAHMGIGVFVLGVTVVSTYDVERDVRLAPGEHAEIAGYSFRFQGTRPIEGPNFKADQGRVEVFRGSRHIVDLFPEKRIYRVQRDVMTQAAVQHNPLRDIYVSLGEPLDEGAWSLRLQYKPMMRLVWFGTILMMLGGFIAATDRRYRRKVSPSVASANMQVGGSNARPSGGTVAENTA